MRGKTYCLPEGWESAIEEWITWLRAGGRSSETIRARRGIIRSVARKLDSVSPCDVTAAQLLQVCGTAEWSADHRRSMRTSLIQFFQWCLAAGLVDENPAVSLPKTPEPKPKPRPVTDAIWSDLLAAAPPRERLMARLAAEAGLRRAEVACLRRADLVQEADGWTLMVHGKGDKQRMVPITHSLADGIRAYSSGWSPRGFIFPGQDHGHASPNWVGKLISDLMPPGWSMHKLRHRYATRGYAGTHNLRAVQEALGHASVATTQRYTAVTSSEVRAVSESAA